MTSQTASRGALGLSGALLGLGYAAFMVAAQLHPHEIDPNNHVLSFAQYAHAANWTLVHLLFFVAVALTICGVLVLFEALDLRAGIPNLASRIGVVATSVALALTAMRYLVDGVVLKRAVDAWASAPSSDVAARFASAETARWLEEATASYQGLVLGFAMIVLAALILGTARVPRPIGMLFGLAGAGYLVVGWILGLDGFAPGGAIPANVAQQVPLLCAIYLLIVAWRTPKSVATQTVETTNLREESYA